MSEREPFAIRLRRIFNSEPQRVEKVAEEERRVAPESRSMYEQVLAEMGVGVEITNQQLLDIGAACGLSIQDLSAAERQYRQTYGEAWEARLIADLTVRINETKGR